MVTEDKGREEGTFFAAAVFGIKIRIHGMFSLLILVFGGMAGAAGDWKIALLIPAVLIVSAIHELGHALAAKRLGYAVQTIVLHPFRGSPSSARAEDPRHALSIALAGPAANLFAAAVVCAGAALSGQFAVGGTSGGGFSGFLQNSLPGRFVFLNGFIALINLLPVFPMDGGQALRSLLAVAGMPQASATQTAVTVSYMIAAVCLAIGVLQGSTYWIIFAALITMGTTYRISNDTFFSAIHHLTVRDVMQRDVRTILLAQTLDSAANSVLPSPQQFFPVLCADDVFGTLSRSALEAGLRAGKGGTYAAESMNRQMVFAAPDEPLKTVLERCRLSPGVPILVGEPGNLLGMVTLESIQKRLADPLPVAGTIN